MITKFCIKYLVKHGFLVLHRGDSILKTVFFDSNGEKWCAWKR